MPTGFIISKSEIHALFLPGFKAKFFSAPYLLVYHEVNSITIIPTSKSKIPIPTIAGCAMFSPHYLYNFKAIISLNILGISPYQVLKNLGLSPL